MYLYVMYEPASLQVRILTTQKFYLLHMFGDLGNTPNSYPEKAMVTKGRDTPLRRPWLHLPSFPHPDLPSLLCFCYPSLSLASGRPTKLWPLTGKHGCEPSVGKWQDW